MAFDRWLFAIVIVVVGGGTLSRLRTMNRAIGREHRRVKQNEEEVDNDRTSSGLDESGVGPEDK